MYLAHSIHSPQQQSLCSIFPMGAQCSQVAAAFLRCTATARRCFRKAVAVESPECALIRLPISFTKAHPRLPHVPRVSMTFGTNSCETDRLAYFDCFFFSASAAAEPAAAADRLMYDGARVSGHVASHSRHLPLDHGASVAPSERLHPCAANPVAHE